jgi:hypothetical protein
MQDVCQERLAEKGKEACKSSSWEALGTNRATLFDLPDSLGKSNSATFEEPAYSWQVNRRSFTDNGLEERPQA